MADAKQKDKAETKTPKKGAKNEKEKEQEMVGKSIPKSIQGARHMSEIVIPS